MRSLLITEEEKKTILGLYSKSPMDVNNTLYSEKSRIKKLMNINEGIDPSDIGKIPIFKKVYELIGIASEGGEKSLEKSRYFSQNLGEYSQKLRQQGINTIDELLERARVWQVENAKLLGVFRDEGSLLEAYIKEQKLFEEIETKLISDNLDEVIASTNKQLDELGNTLGLSAEEKAEMSGGVDLKGKSQAEIDEADAKLDTSQKLVQDILEDVQIQKKAIENIDPKFRDARQNALLKNLTEQERRLQKYLTALERQRKAYQKASEQLDDAKIRYDNTVNWQGKVFNPSKLTFLQRCWYKFSLDKLPDFFTLIFRFISKVVTFQRVKLLQEELGEKLARLAELQRKITEGYQSEALLREMEYLSKELNMLTRNLQGKDVAYNYKGGTPTAYEYFVRFIKGGTGAESTDIADVWMRITGMLQNQVNTGKLTQDEASAILKRIKTVYTQVQTPGESKLENFIGMFKFRYDLDEIAKEQGYKELPEELPGEGKLVKELQERQSDTSSWIEKYFRKAAESVGIGGDGQKWWKGMILGICRIIRNELIFGLPLNLKYYLKPLSRGFNLKNIAITVGKLALAKAFVAWFFGGMGAYIRYYVMLNEMGISKKTPEQCESEAWQTWNEEMEKYRNMDLTEIITDVVSIDRSIETTRNPATALKEPKRAEYAREVNLKYGPLRFKFGEFVLEELSRSKSMPTQPEMALFMKIEAQKIEKNLKEDVKELNKDGAKLFYSLDEKTQAEWADSRFTEIMEDGDFYAEQFTPEERKLFVKRTFYRSSYVGVFPSEIKTDEQKLEFFLDKGKYLPDVCVCKKNLTYKEEAVAGKICNIPQCDDYVRIKARRPILFSDKDKYDIPADGVYGFLIGNSAKSETNSYSDWKPMSELTNYVK